jgi:Na+-translocating ferredoxin:NAD+ oxidoreductase RNF subunit RnfB
MNDVEVNLCPVGGEGTASKVAEIMGKETSAMEKQVARIHCQGGQYNTNDKFVYEGPKTCAGAQQIRGGFRVCSYGCLGFGDCEVSCPFNAISMGEDRLPVVDPEKCTGCGNCVSACPRMIISLKAASQEVYVKCNNKEKGPVMKQGCSVGCIGCKLCVVKACKKVFAENENVESAISVDNFLARVDGAVCVNCGECSDVCPQDVITVPASKPAASAE